MIHPALRVRIIKGQTVKIVYPLTRGKNKTAADVIARVAWVGPLRDTPDSLWATQRLGLDVDGRRVWIDSSRVEKIGD